MFDSSGSIIDTYIIRDFPGLGKKRVANPGVFGGSAAGLYRTPGDEKVLKPRKQACE